jgi:hypothetical protein
MAESSPQTRAGTGPAWDDRYPDRDELRREIEGMVAAFLEAILLNFPPGAIAGITRKGSSLKPWDSPLDYVPELSDVDLHVLFEEDVPPYERHFSRLESALDMQRHLDEGFRRRIPHPIHVPRIQMIVANVLHREPNFVPAPQQTERTIYGRSDPLPEVDRDRSRAVCVTHLLEHEPYVRKLPEDVADKTDRYLWPVLRTMTWRVGPTAPRALEVLGTPYEEAWGMNRTRLYHALGAAGEETLAEEYARFYLQGWRYFLSGYADGDAVRGALLAGARVLEAGIRLARQIGPTLGEI